MPTIKINIPNQTFHCIHRTWSVWPEITKRWILAISCPRRLHDEWSWQGSSKRFLHLIFRLCSDTKTYLEIYGAIVFNCSWDEKSIQCTYMWTSLNQLLSTVTPVAKPKFSLINREYCMHFRYYRPHWQSNQIERKHVNSQAIKMCSAIMMLINYDRS